MLLSTQGIQVNSKDRWGNTPLRDAVREGHKVISKALLEAGGRLELGEVETAGELCELAKQGSLDRLDLLIRSGASPNATDYDNRTALHLASSVGNLPIVQLLVEHGVEVNAQDRCAKGKP